MVNDGAPYVLLIEDDPSTRQLVKHILEEELGVAVRETNDGAKALAMLDGAGMPPALLVVDLMLPRMDGETFMMEVRRLLGPDLPIIVMSAMDPIQVRSSAEHVGAQGVVLKPFNVGDLVREVRDALQLNTTALIVDLEAVRRRREAASKSAPEEPEPPRHAPSRRSPRPS